MGISVVCNMEYSLQRNGFHTHLNKYFKEDKKFLDVTLACDDQYQTKAHKIILSAGSPFFENILSKSKHQESFIFLNGIKEKELKNMLHFLYNGETSVAEEEVQEFLKILKMLDLDTEQITYTNAGEKKGITGSLGNLIGDSDDLDLELDQHGFADNHMDDGEYRNTMNKTAIKTEDQWSEKLLTVEVNEENVNKSVKEGAITEDKGHNVEDSEEMGQTLPGMTTTNEKEEIESDTMTDNDDLCVKVDGLWECKICGKTYVKRYHANRHALTHNTETHICNICGKTLKTEDSLQKHVSYVHCTEIFSCKVCGKENMSKTQFKNHTYLSKPCRKA